MATVTEEPRLDMVWNGKTIVDISREFLNSNGAAKHQNVHIEKADCLTAPVGRRDLRAEA